MIAHMASANKVCS